MNWEVCILEPNCFSKLRSIIFRPIRLFCSVNHLLVGDLLGLFDGGLVGDLLGLFDGDLVGALVGDLVGFLVGLIGLSVGDNVCKRILEVRQLFEKIG
jgi:hypothetical protein